MNIMVVSPHPDDETLGAGGTIIKMKRKGNKIFWLNVTDVTEEMGWDRGFIQHRKEQIRKVRDYYGFEDFYNLELPATKLSQMDEADIIKRIKKIYDEAEPEWLIIPGQYDAHSDHRVTYNSCMAAAKTFRSPYIKKITTMEIASETDYGFQGIRFEPNLFIDITGEIEGKLTAMKIYDTELEDDPFPRSIEKIKALAEAHGSVCNSKYVEAFQILKCIE